jgi:hypothetical protein
MTPQEFRAVVTLVRRAPLQNMQEAEAAALLIQKLEQLANPAPADTVPPAVDEPKRKRRGTR